MTKIVTFSITMLLISILMSGCALFGDKVSGNLSGTHVTMKQGVGEVYGELQYHNPKDVGGEFQAKAWMRPADGGFDMGVSGGAANGTSIDLAHAVEQTKAQMEVMKDGIAALGSLARNFPGLTP